MENKIIELIKMITILGEVVIDMDLSIGSFQTITLYQDDTLLLHRFDESDFDFYVSFDDLIELDKEKIYDTLKVLVYN